MAEVIAMLVAAVAAAVAVSEKRTLWAVLPTTEYDMAHDSVVVVAAAAVVGKALDKGQDSLCLGEPQQWKSWLYWRRHHPRRTNSNLNSIWQWRLGNHIQLPLPLPEPDNSDRIALVELLDWWWPYSKLLKRSVADL